jgi:hypothetical protein
MSARRIPFNLFGRSLVARERHQLLPTPPVAGPVVDTAQEAAHVHA